MSWESAVVEFSSTYYARVGDFVYQFYAQNSRAILDTFHLLFKGTFTFVLWLTAGIALVYMIMALIVMLTKRRTHSQAIPRGKEPTVTVQIPTYNELAAITCAKRCLAFDYPAQKMQIIIGDDSNDPKTKAAIDRFAAAHKDRILVTRRGANVGFKPGNLNHMLKYTTGEIIVIFDSDFLPEKDFLRRIVAPIAADRSVAVSQARWRITNFRQNGVSVLGGTITMLCHNVMLAFIDRTGSNAFLCGSAEAIRRSDLEKAGGWLTGALTEDIECSLRLYQRGRRLVYLEDLSCGCEAPHTVRDLCKQQMRWAFGVITAFKMHWRKLFFTARPRARDKMSAMLFGSGYFFSVLLLLITVFGVLSLLSDRPAPIDWVLFLSETGRNLLLTSGFLLASVLALIVGGELKAIPKMVVSSLTVGLIVTYYVNVGIVKALLGRNMRWFMLTKNGNKIPGMRSTPRPDSG